MAKNIKDVKDAYMRNVVKEIENHVGELGVNLLDKAYDAGVADGAMKGVPWNTDKTVAPYRKQVIVTIMTMDDNDNPHYDVAMGERISNRSKSATAEWMVNNRILEDSEIVAWTDAVKPFIPDVPRIPFPY